MPPALPLELTDAIIHHLYADHPALVACSLVCRAWRGAAQHHLLATIFCTGVRLMQLLAQLEAKDSPSLVREGQSNTKNSDPWVVGGEGVSGAVDAKSLSESFSARVREVWVRDPEDKMPNFDVGMMARVLAVLPNLHTLHLVRVSLVPSNASHARNTQPAEARGRCRLRWLDLGMVYLSDMRQLSAVLGLCAEVRKLTLRCFYSSWDLHVEEEGERTRCESLAVDGDWPLSFQVWPLLRIETLKAYEVKRPKLKHVPMVLEMLDAVAGSLESLTLHLSAVDPVSVWEPLSAIPWAALTRISVICEIFDDDDPLHLLPIALLLSYLPEAISTIELQLNESNLLAALQDFGWNSLETQLSRFTNLRSLTIRLRSYEPAREGLFLEAARTGMPALAARGLLA